MASRGGNKASGSVAQSVQRGKAEAAFETHVDHAHHTHHRSIYWAEVELGKDAQDLDHQELIELIEEHGIPEKLLLAYWQDELRDEKAVMSLPRALALIFAFALMMILKEVPSNAQLVDRAITHDITENANFAFGLAMGHKNYEDVNSYADFWSWMRLGFSAIYLPQSTAVSEGSSLPSVPLRETQAERFLWHNQKIGPVRLSQEKLQPAADCPNPKFAKEARLSCWKPGSLSLAIPPTEYDVETSDFVEDAGSTVWLNYFGPQVSNVLEDLERRRWLNESTHHAEVSFITYNAQEDILVVTDVHFIFPRSGTIWKKIGIRPIYMKPYAQWYAYVFEIIFYGIITTIFLEEVFELVGSGRESGCGLQMFWNYIGFWNTVDWISIIWAYYMLGLWINLYSRQQTLQEELIKYEDHMDECRRGIVTDCDLARFASVWKIASECGSLARMYGFVMGFYPVCIMLRLFKAFAGQPRLALVTNTLMRASGHLFHFGIIFMSVFVTYGFMGQSFFGRDIPGFATVGLSLMTLFGVLMGDFDVSVQYNRAGHIAGAFFFGSYMLFTLLILFNMLIAIIMDVYSDVKGQCCKSDPIWNTAGDIIRRTIMNFRRQRLPLDKALSSYLKKVGEEALHSERPIRVADLLENVPGLGENQARRNLTHALDRHTRISGTVDVETSEVLSCAQSLRNEHRHIAEELMFAAEDVKSLDMMRLAERESLLDENVSSAEKDVELNIAMSHSMQSLLGAALLHLRDSEISDGGAFDGKGLVERDRMLLEQVLGMAESLCNSDDWSCVKRL